MAADGIPLSMVLWASVRQGGGARQVIDWRYTGVGWYIIGGAVNYRAGQYYRAL